MVAATHLSTQTTPPSLERERDFLRTTPLLQRKTEGFFCPRHPPFDGNARWRGCFGPEMAQMDFWISVWSPLAFALLDSAELAICRLNYLNNTHRRPGYPEGAKSATIVVRSPQALTKRLWRQSLSRCPLPNISIPISVPFTLRHPQQPHIIVSRPQPSFKDWEKEADHEEFSWRLHGGAQKTIPSMGLVMGTRKGKGTTHQCHD